jgi:hypothetical protein
MFSAIDRLSCSANLAFQNDAAGRLCMVDEPDYPPDGDYGADLVKILIPGLKDWA